MHYADIRQARSWQSNVNDAGLIPSMKQENLTCKGSDIIYVRFDGEFPGLGGTERNLHIAQTRMRRFGATIVVGAGKSDNCARRLYVVG